MEKIIPSAELFGVLFLLVIIRGLYRKGMEKSKKIRIFRLMVWATVFSLICDALSYIAPAARWIQFSSNMLCYLMTPVIMTLFGFFITAVIREHTPISNRIATIITLVNIVDVAVIVAGSVNGKLFSFSGNEFVFGPWVDNICIPLICCVFFLCLMVMIYAGRIGRREVASLSFYILPLVAALIIEMIRPELAFCTASIAISIQIIYVLLVVREDEAARAREKILADMAYADILTGLNNRRMFNEKLLGLPKDALAGVIYCDVNGLKETNDTYGHEAGDALLLRFTEVLGTYFGEHELFRISGDEFVVLTTAYSREAFNALVAAFIAHVQSMDDIASVGSAFGNAEIVRSLVTESEQKMYRSKREYYEREGHDRRAR